MIRLVLMCLILAVPNWAAARDAALACVQGQLRALGYDPGPADGFWGQRTQSGAAAFAASAGADMGLPDLTPHNSSVLCRQIGLLDEGMRRFWPVSGRAAFDVSPRGLEPGAARDLAALTQVMFERYDARFDLQLAEPVKVLVGKTQADLRSLWQGALGARYSPAGFDTIYQQSCGEADQIGGFTSGSVVALCLPDGRVPREARRMWLLQTTLAHELYHAVQRQLVGGPRPDQARDTVNYAGPEWLIEGSATYFSLRATLPEALMEASYGRLAARVATRADLAVLEPHLARATQRTALYDQGAYAAYLLARGDNGRALMRYYELVGLGQDWQDAFALAFGVPVGQFYADYATGVDKRDDP